MFKFTCSVNMRAFSALLLCCKALSPLAGPFRSSAFRCVPSKSVDQREGGAGKWLPNRDLKLRAGKLLKVVDPIRFPGKHTYGQDRDVRDTLMGQNETKADKLEDYLKLLHALLKTS